MNQYGDRYARRGEDSESRIDVDKPLWSQDTYFGRWMHYAFITDCRTIFVSERKLRKAKKLCDDYKAGKEPAGVQRKDIIYAKKLRDSAFHPDTGELMHVLGRMSSQLPSSIVLTTAMLTFYKSACGIIVCQLVNQGINAIINYTNRNPMSDDPEDINMVHQAFALATTASCAAALGFRKILANKGTLFTVTFCSILCCCSRQHSESTHHETTRDHSGNSDLHQRQGGVHYDVASSRHQGYFRVHRHQDINGGTRNAVSPSDDSTFTTILFLSASTVARHAYRDQSEHNLFADHDPLGARHLSAKKFNETGTDEDVSGRIRGVSKGNGRLHASGQSLLQQGIIIGMDKEKIIYIPLIVRLSIRFMKSGILQVTKMDKATM